MPYRLAGGVLRVLLGLVLAMQARPLAAQELPEYLDDLKEHRITETTITQFLKGIVAEKEANAAALERLSKGQTGMGAMGSLMRCMPTPGAEPDLTRMGQCGGDMADEQSPQQRASGLEDEVFEAMKQRLWIYFDGKPAEKRAQFSAAELAVIEKHRGELAAFRDRYVSPHPEC